MEAASLSAQTRQQVERARRTAEEARERIRAAKGGKLRLDPDRRRSFEGELQNEELAREAGID